MNKLLTLLLTLVMVLCLAACGGGNDKPSGDDDTSVASQQEQENISKPDEDEAPESDTQSDSKEDQPYEDETGKDAWPESDVTALVPTPAQGKVTLASIDETSAIIEVSWTYDEVLAYVQQLQDAGFGDDAVETFEELKTLRRTNNGVEIYLVYLDDTWTQINITVQ